MELKQFLYEYKCRRRDYNNVTCTQHYIPPIIDDDAIPDDYNSDELRGINGIPSKRIKAGWDGLNPNNHHLKIADFDVGETQRVFYIPLFTYNNNFELIGFFAHHVNKPD